MGELLLRVVLTPRAQNRKDVPWTKNSAGVVVFVSDVDDAPHWIEAGRCYERFALQATVLGLRNAFINQPVEIATLRNRLATWLGVGSRRPDLLVRFGYGPEMPKSFRRPVTAVLSAAG
uniref:Nitroreductase domain-containing protein n=1 Tax=candidate division WOR-3 bacterium TaxID=2052148 RepID=A0A7C4CCH4_UNCW3